MRLTAVTVEITADQVGDLAAERVEKDRDWRHRVLFDQPTSALDPELVGSVLGVMRSLRESGMTMIVVSHEIGFPRNAADRVVFMDEGAIVEEGPPAVIFERPAHERTRAFIGQIQRH